jgi:hypothetical protein
MLAGWAAPTLAWAEARRAVADDGQLLLLKDFPLLRQPDAISCGPTCCSMLLKYYGLRADIADVKDTAGTRLFKFGDEEVGFTWPSHVRKALMEHGLEAELVRESSLGEVAELVGENRPPILLVRSSARTWHYVVVTGRRGKNRFRVADPLGREYWLDADTLDQAWTFDGDLRGKAIAGGECQICRGNGRVGFVSCLVCGGDGELPDIRRQVVESNLIERVTIRTLIAPAFSATPA